MIREKIWLAGVCAAISVLQAVPARAQNSSLFSRDMQQYGSSPQYGSNPQYGGNPRSGSSLQYGSNPLRDNQVVGDPGLTLKDTSWTYTPIPPPREIQRHDIVSVRVDVLSRMAADGELRRRKDARYDARLKDWVTLDGLRAVRPDPQSTGEPRIRGELRSDYRSVGELETSESLAFNLACEVVDIRPNGNLVLEGRSKIVLNDECWTYVLSGLCRPEAIGPNNVILSRDIINLDIRKDETGSVASGYQRGWFQKIFDLFQPF